MNELISFFLATNLDDVVILVLLISQINATFRHQHIVLGQLLLVLITLLYLAFAQPSFAASMNFAQEMDPFAVGQRVTLLYKARADASYLRRVPAEIVKLNPKQVQVKVQQNNGEFVTRWVRRDKLELNPI